MANDALVEEIAVVLATAHRSNTPYQDMGGPRMKLATSIAICILSTMAILFAVTEPGSELYALPFFIIGSVAYGYALRAIKEQHIQIYYSSTRWAANDNDHWREPVLPSWLDEGN